MSHTAAFEDRLPPRALAAAPAGWRPAFLGDWAGATFAHFAVEPRRLQPFVPFELDLHEGEAYVSLVAFTMRHARPAWLDSPLGESLLWPIMPCRFLNVRTYVRAAGADGIYFLGEWLSRWVNIPLGPLLYGLPYQPGRLRFERDEAARTLAVDVRGIGGARLAFRSASDPRRPFATAAPGSLDAFLLERYLAFTMRRARPLAFHVEHEPWQSVAADIALDEAGLLRETGDWIDHARLAGGHFTTGAHGVAMGAPEPIAHPAHAAPRSAFLG